MGWRGFLRLQCVIHPISGKLWSSEDNLLMQVEVVLLASQSKGKHEDFGNFVVSFQTLFNLGSNSRFPSDIDMYTLTTRESTLVSILARGMAACKLALPCCHHVMCPNQDSFLVFKFSPGLLANR
uniref:Uncharacterized protein n=1 Tax=Rhizophora mucronata TaxID=61149 RepID=A0A2P2J6D1_RHIMU